LQYGRFERRSYGMRGIEIGASAHNQFFLNIPNVDYSTSMGTLSKKQESKACGTKRRVDVAAYGCTLPFKSKSLDFIISSHVIEHFWDPIAALLGWRNIACKYLFMIIPHKERTPDRIRPLTALSELIDRHEGKVPAKRREDHHWSVWNTQSFLELCGYLKMEIAECQDPDDKVGNGFSVVIKI
jgi:SAM-dependent methyltransferase